MTLSFLLHVFCLKKKTNFRLDKNLKFETIDGMNEKC